MSHIVHGVFYDLVGASAYRDWYDPEGIAIELDYPEDDEPISRDGDDEVLVIFVQQRRQVRR